MILDVHNVTAECQTGLLNMHAWTAEAQAERVADLHSPSREQSSQAPRLQGKKNELLQMQVCVVAGALNRQHDHLFFLTLALT